MTINEANEILNKEDLNISQLLGVMKYLTELVNEKGGLEIANTCVLLKNKAIKFENFEKEYFPILNLLCVKGYLHTVYHWRGKKYAYFAYLGLKDKVTQKGFKQNAYEYFNLLGCFYSACLDQMNALKCYECAYECAERLDEIIESYYNTIVCHKLLDSNYKSKFSDEDIMCQFPNDGKRIIAALNNKGFLKHDPIENTKKFQDVYDEVCEETRVIIGDRDTTPQMYWSAFYDCLIKRGIIWKNPHIMNPHVMFD